MEILEKKEKSKRKRNLFLVVFIPICAVVGVNTGIFIADQFKPAPEAIKNIDYIDYDKLLKRAENKNNILKEFEKDAYNLVNVACYNQAQSPYSYTVATSLVDAGIAKQEVMTATYKTPEKVFNQNVSQSTFVKTAFRFYDEKDGTVLAYESKYKEDWQKEGLEPIEYTYDDYIQTYGKLHQGLYYVAPSDEPNLAINEKYVNKNDASKNKNAQLIQSTIIYDLTESSVLTSSIEKKGEAFLVKIDLNIVNGNCAGITHYQIQMKKNGGLKSNPQFKNSHLEFLINSKDLTLISAKYNEKYTVNVIGTNHSSQKMEVFFFKSNSSIFTRTSSELVQKEITIPEINDINFSGFDFFNPKEDKI